MSLLIFFFLLTYFCPSFINLPSPPPLPQVLGSSSKPGGFSAELHEVHHQFALPPLPLHCGVCLVGDAAVWRTVSINTNLESGSRLLINYMFLYFFVYVIVMIFLIFWFNFFSFLLLRFNFEGGTPPTNFDTFAAAIMTVFQVRGDTTKLN